MKFLVLTNLQATVISCINACVTWFMVIAGGFYLSEALGTAAAVFAVLFHIVLEAIDYRLDSEDVIILERKEQEEVEEDEDQD